MRNEERLYKMGIAHVWIILSQYPSRLVFLKFNLLVHRHYCIDDIHTLSSKSIAAERVGEHVPEIFPKEFSLVFVSGSAIYVVIQMRLLIYYIYAQSII